MKKFLNKIECDVVLDIIKNADLKIEEMSAFFKCTYGENQARIYVARTQKVSRIHLAGFTILCPGVTQISAQEAKELRMGSVRGEFDFSEPSEIVLEALNRACKAVKAIDTLKGIGNGPFMIGPDVPTTLEEND